jgi:hypothetical protein
MTTTPPAPVTPTLLSATQTPTDGGMSIDLRFDIAMAAGSGTIFITDGAVQTVIDRATGQPTMRVVGATDTHTVSAAGVSVDGTHVKLTVPGLLPGHAYSVVMGAGVLTSSAHVAFGGLRSTSELQFSTPATPDHEGPSLVSSEIDGSLLVSGGSLHVTLTFSEAVNALGVDALNAPNATVSELVRVGDGHSWRATLTPAGALEQAGNVFSVDMSKVHDAAGNAGSGSVPATQTYDVDTAGPTAAILLDGAELRYGTDIGVTITLSDGVTKEDLVSALAAQHAAFNDDLHLTEDGGGLVWKATLKPGAGAAAATNAVTLDLGKLHDAHGNAGVGTAASPNYAVDTIVAAYVDSAVRIQDGTGASDYDNVTNDSNQSIFGTLSGELGAGQHLHLTIKGSSTVEYDLAPGAREWDFGDSAYHFADGVYTITAQVLDASGHGSTAATQQITIDTAGPAMLTSPDGASGNAGDELVFTFDEAVYLIDDEGVSISIADADGGKTEVYLNEDNFSADRKTVTIPASQHHLQAGKAYTIALSSAITDLAGNPIQHLAPLHFSTSGGDTLVPWATAAVFQASPGIYGIGAEIDIAVSFSEAVRQAGGVTPVLHLNNGGVATWDHTSGDGHTVIFKYLVGANGENDTSGLESLALADNTDLAGHVSDLAGNLLDQAHIAFPALATPGIIQVDAHASPAPGTPVLANDTGVAGDGITSAPVFAGSGAASFAAIKLFDNGTLIGTTSSNADGNWTIGSFTLPDGTHTLLDGAHTLTARQYDGANNESPASSALRITVDSSAPNKPGKPVLDAASDSGSSSSDGITNDKTPTISGTAAESGATVKVYEGGALLGTTIAGAGGAWSFTVGSQGGYPATLADGVHNLTVNQFDAAGNLSAASDSLAITIDTVGPTITSSKLDWTSDKHRYKVEFSEKIVFAGGSAVDVLSALNLLQSHHAGSAQTNWAIDTNDKGVESVLELNLVGLIGLLGHFHLKADGNAIQDVAGNAATIGVPGFDIPGLF